MDDLTPYLYDSSEFSFTSNGIGNLKDAASCKVTEERNGAFELEMEYPTSGAFYDEIKMGRYILARPAPRRDPQAFEIYRITKPIDDLVTIYAQHISYRLSKIPLSPFTAEDIQGAFQKIPQNVLEPCPFTFWTDKITVAHYETDVPASLRSRLGGSSGSFLDVYGGEYEFDQFTVKLWNHRGADRGVQILYGKNLEDLKQEESIESTITGAIAYWKGQDPTTETETIVISDLQQSQYANLYPYHRTEVLDLSGEFQNPPSKQTLNNYLNTYLQQNGIGIPKVNLEVSFVDLRDTTEYADTISVLTEDVRLCDTLTVRFDALGVDASAKVIQTEYDVLSGHYNKIKLGDPRTKFTDSVSKIEEKADSAISQSDLEAAVANATAQITGASGGWIVDRYDSDGNRYEMLIMDTNNILTAQNVWRFNQNGWAHSSTGYNGPYTLAATQDGAIVADLITSGTLNANIIKAGIIQGQVGDSYWNIATGEIYLSSYATNTSVTQLVNSTRTDIESELTREINSLSSTIAATYARADDVQAEFDLIEDHWESYITDDSGNYICDDDMNRLIAVKLYYTTDATRTMIEQTADSITLQVEGYRREAQEYHQEDVREYQSLQSQIVMTENSILQEVSATYARADDVSSAFDEVNDHWESTITDDSGNYICDDNLNHLIAVKLYYTTDQTRTLVEQTSDSITLKVEGYHAQDQQNIEFLSSQIVMTENSILQEVSKKTTDSEIISSIQNKIDNDGASITFRTGSLIIDSNNFSLDRSGNATFSGNISGSTISGSRFIATSGNYVFKIIGATFKFYNNDIYKADFVFGDATHSGVTYTDVMRLKSPAIWLEATSASGLNSLYLANSSGSTFINLSNNLLINTGSSSADIDIHSAGDLDLYAAYNISIRCPSDITLNSAGGSVIVNNLYCNNWRFVGSTNTNRYPFIESITVNSDGTLRSWITSYMYHDEGILTAIS